MMIKSFHTFQRRLFIAAFGLILFAPLCLTPFKTFPKPELSPRAIRNYQYAFEPHFNLHFGGRRLFIYLNSCVRLLGFQQSPIKQVVKGKDGWFFYGGDKLTEEFTGETKLTISDLEGWRKHIEQSRDWLAQRGIEYLFVTVPNKHSIYPEFMPDNFKKSKQSSLDLLLDHLNQHSDVTILDLRNPLLEAKKDHIVYDKTDTHWNIHGAFAAYEAMMNQIVPHMPSLSPLTKDQLNITTFERKGGDIIQYTGLENSIREYSHTWTPNFQSGVSVPTNLPPLVGLTPPRWMKDTRRAWQARQCPGAKGSETVVFRDSFFDILIPLFSENFKKTYYVWSKMNPAIMDQILAQDKISLVIDIHVERTLKHIDRSAE